MPSLLDWKKTPGRAATFGNDQTLTESFTAVLDVRNATQAQVYSLVSGNVPTTHPSNSAARLTGFSIEQEQDAPTVWRVKPTYSTNADAQTDPEPWTLPAVVERDYEEYELTLTEDIHGDPLINTAKDPYSDITRPARRRVINMSWNSLTWTDAFSDDYCDVVNTTSFFGRGPDEVLCMGVPAKEAWTALGVKYYQVSAKFLCAAVDKTWKRRIRSTGLYEIAGSNADGTPLKRRILDDEGEPIETPAFLNEEGTLVKDPDAAFIKEFELFERRSFNVFPRTS